MEQQWFHTYLSKVMIWWTCLHSTSMLDEPDEMGVYRCLLQRKIFPNNGV